MRRILQSSGIGLPQFLAAGLLLLYLGECVWLIRAQVLHGVGVESGQLARIAIGARQWHGGPVAGTPQSESSDTTSSTAGNVHAGGRVQEGFDQDRSPLYFLTAATPALVPAGWVRNVLDWQLLARAPYLFFGVMLGGSLWYVARRLYGNAGGYVALAFYCFSPAMIVGAAGVQSLGEIGAVWGAFGTIWTGIAVAHTLYAPREVVLWNWRRIVLLGLSVALAVGNQFSLALLVVVSFGLMLWAAPVRRGAVLAIWGAACGLALVFLVASYSFDLQLFWQGVRHARWLDFEVAALGTAVSYRHISEEIFRGSPPLMLLLPGTLVAFVAWKRARYFGNAAPLGIAVLLLLMAMSAPGFPGQGFQLVALTFLFVFVAGVIADMLETRRGPWVMAAVTGLLIAAACWNILELARAG